MVLKKSRLILFVIPILIFALGLVTLMSVAPERVTSHVAFFGIGALALVLLTYFDSSIFKYFWKYIYAIGLFFLLLTFILGDIRYGAARWVSIGTFGFQPSEFAKVALIISLSSYISSLKSGINTIRTIVTLGLLFLPYVLLVYVQPDLGTSLILTAIFLSIVFYAGLDKFYFIISALLLGIFSAPIWSILHDYQKARILVFINPRLDVLGSGYNVIQSLIAIGSGGIFGKGFGMGTQAALSFLPAYWTDFIFASFAEEWGFVGVAILLLFFAILLLTLVHIAASASDTYSGLICAGTFALFLAQFMINVGMNLGVMPVTGVTLPLVSYGGSSIITSMVLLGLCNNIWQRA